jgi:hypothetical protein
MMAVRRHLQTGCNKTPARRRHAWWAGGLSGLLLVLLVAGSVQAVHGHGDPGLYDEECPSSGVGESGDEDRRHGVGSRHQRRHGGYSLAFFDPRAPPLPTLSPAFAH